MKLLLAAAMLAAPTAAVAQEPEAFCQDVRRLDRGAAETPPFRSLLAEDFRPRLLRYGCSFSDAGGYACGQSLAPPGLTRESIAARIQACLPGATLTVRRDFQNHEIIVRRGPFRATVTEHGAPRAHVGRIINIFLAAEPAAPETSRR